MPPLATPDDVADLHPDLDLDVTQTEALLVIASAMARQVAGRTWVNEDDELEDVPDGVTEIVASMVGRALRNPRGVTQETTGPFNVSYGASAAERLFLTKAERLVLRGGSQKAYTVTPYAEPEAVGDLHWI